MAKKTVSNTRLGIARLQAKIEELSAWVSERIAEARALRAERQERISPLLAVEAEAHKAADLLADDITCLEFRSTYHRERAEDHLRKARQAEAEAGERRKMLSDVTLPAAEAATAAVKAFKIQWRRIVSLRLDAGRYRRKSSELKRIRRRLEARISERSRWTKQPSSTDVMLRAPDGEYGTPREGRGAP